VFKSASCPPIPRPAPSLTLTLGAVSGYTSAAGGQQDEDTGPLTLGAKSTTQLCILLARDRG
jgi:hypothetical protein